jgi:L-iditol 2-dehydrogenase
MMRHKVPATMHAVVYRGPNLLQLESLPVPPIGPDELLVRVAACGVCPTDIKKIQHGTVPAPRVFGHETAGTIVRVGARVKQFEPGQRVALHHHVPCLDCHACRHRAYAQCAGYKRTGITAGFEPAGGGFAEYVRVMPFVFPGVVPIPQRNSFLEGAMLEPVNTVLKAVLRLDLLPGDTVLVVGQGPIGLMFTRLLALKDINVIACDLVEPKLQYARQFGARWTLPGDLASVVEPLGRIVDLGSSASNPPQKQKVESRKQKAESRKQKAESRKQKAKSRPPLDAVIVAVPVDSVVPAALRLVRGAGKVLLFAHTRRGAESPLDLGAICADEKDVIGSYSSDVTLQEEVAKLVFSRQFDVRPLITHRFPLAQTPEAIALAAKPKPDSLKVLVDVDPAPPDR